MPVLLAGLAATLLGAGDFLAGLSGRRNAHAGASMSLAWLASVVGTFCAAVFVAIFPPDVFGRADMLWSLLAGAFVAAARPLLYLGMERGPMAVFAPVVGVTALVVPSIIGPLTGDSLAGLEVAGVVISVPAVVLIVSGGALSLAAVMQSRPALLLGVLTGALIGAASLCFGQINEDAGAMPALISQGVAVIAIPLVARSVEPMAPVDRSLVWFGVVVGFIDIVAIIASVIAFQLGNVAVVAAVMGFAPAVTIACAWRVFGERVRGWQWVGSAIAAAAIVLFAAA